MSHFIFDWLENVLSEAIEDRCSELLSSVSKEEVLEVIQTLKQSASVISRVLDRFETAVIDSDESSDSSRSSSSSDSSKSSPSSASSDSSKSSDSSASSKSSASSATSASSNSSNSSASSKSSSSSASSSASSQSSSSSSVAIVPVPPPPSIARIGMGINPQNNRTQYAFSVLTLVSNDAEFAAALAKAVAGGISAPDCIALRGDITVNYPRNALRGLKRSAQFPLVITTVSGQPKASISGLQQDQGQVEGVAWINVDVNGTTMLRGPGLKHWLFEDVDGGFDLQGQDLGSRVAGEPIDNCNLRYCKMLDRWTVAASSMIHGLFSWNRKDFLMEYCVLDHNGWKPGVARDYDPNQGGPTSRNHNAYLAAPAINDTVRYNVLARASSHGLHARTGGNIHDNLVIECPIGIQFGYGDDGYFNKYGLVSGMCYDNVLLGSDVITKSSNVGGTGIWITCCQHPTTISGNVGLRSGDLGNNNQRALFRLETQYPITASLDNNKSHRWGLPSGMYTEPGIHIPLITQGSGNRFEVPYSDQALLQSINTTSLIDGFRLNGIDAAEFSRLMSSLRDGF